MTERPGINIRPMLSADLASAFDLSKAEGWNQTQMDWNFLLTNPGNICLVAESKSRIVGTATALIHSKRLAWIGMVIVDKEMRGHGIGKQLMTSIIDKLATIESVKLDATPAGLPLYRKLGFIEEYDLIRMVNPAVDLNRFKESEFEPSIPDIGSFKAIVRLDERIFGCGRLSLLNYLFSKYPERAYILNLSDKTEGYILGREGFRYSYIGPLVAFSNESAIILFKKVLKYLEGKQAAIDVHLSKEEFLTWLESAGFIKQRSFVRMYLRNNNYPGEIINQYLISGPEFG